MPEQTDTPTKKIYYDQRSVAIRTKQVVYFVQEHDKVSMLDMLMQNMETKQSVIVVKSKSKADELSKHLSSKSFKAVSVHGNHRSEQQIAAATTFNAQKIDIIITTDMILQLLI